MSSAKQSKWLRPVAAILLVVAVAFVVLPLVFNEPNAQQGLEVGFFDEPERSEDGPAPDDAPRAIAPARFATPFAQNAVHLERIAPRPPLTPTVERETGPRPTLLHKPLVISAGEVAFPQGTIRLKGLVVTEPDETCTAPNGDLWPCGILARTAFRNFVSGRSLSCILPQEDWSDTITVSCLVGKQDPAAWLVTRGWARAFFGSNYASLEREAQEEGRGLYGSDPRDIAAIPDSNTVIEPDGVNPGQDPLPVPLR
ncbi:MAG: thermonuclease family protein [Pseudomonadota bacterium]